MAYAGGMLFGALAKKQCKHIEDFCQVLDSTFDWLTNQNCWIALLSFFPVIQVNVVQYVAPLVVALEKEIVIFVLETNQILGLRWNN